MTTKKKSGFYSVNIDVPDERIEAMLFCAFEGGTGYWCRIESPYSEKAVEAVVAGTGTMTLSECEDGSIILTHVLDRAKCQRGLRLLPTIAGGRHLDDLLAESDDAETGDVFLQLALLGEVRYG